MTPEGMLIEETFNIVNKDGEKVPFRLNEVQRKFDEEQTERNIIVKARQEGFSSYISAYIAIRCLGTRNLRCVLIAHDSESTEKIFDRVRFFLNNSQKELKPDLSRSSRREFFFREMNSTFYIGTAGSDNFGRGDTINLLHCSEVAQWERPQELTAGLFEAVPRRGRIWLESTARGQGNWFHNRALKAREGKSRYRMHFYPWHWFEEYALGRPEWPAWWGGVEGRLSSDELSLQEEFNLSMDQLAWRFDKMNEMDDSDLAGGRNLFPQEYPITFEEAFLASGSPIFGQIPAATATGRVVGELETFRDPVPGHQYVIGLDVGGGVGGDYSVAIGIDCDTFEQAFVWSSNEVDPDELAEPVAELAARYNRAWVVPELNNHGIATVAALRRIYLPGRIMQRYSYEKREAIERLGRLGWLTTEKSKGVLIANLRRALREGLKVYSVRSRNELTTYVL
jgi:hypothetical protein